MLDGAAEADGVVDEIEGEGLLCDHLHPRRRHVVDGDGGLKECSNAAPLVLAQGPGLRLSLLLLLLRAPPAEFRQDLNVPLLPLRCRQALADATGLDADVERACGSEQARRRTGTRKKTAYLFLVFFLASA
jgi:hypothetical protein